MKMMRIFLVGTLALGKLCVHSYLSIDFIIIRFLSHSFYLVGQYEVSYGKNNSSVQ